MYWDCVVCGVCVGGRAGLESSLPISAPVFFPPSYLPASATPVPSNMSHCSCGILILKCGHYLWVYIVENMMYVKDRPRTPKPYTMASSLVFPKSTKRKKKAKYLIWHFLRILKEVLMHFLQWGIFLLVPPHTLTSHYISNVLPTTSPTDRIFSQTLEAGGSRAQCGNCGVRLTWAWFHTLPFSRYVTQNNLVHVSEPQFAYLYNGNNNNKLGSHIVGLRAEACESPSPANTWYSETVPNMTICIHSVVFL